MHIICQLRTILILSCCTLIFWGCGGGGGGGGGGSNSATEGLVITSKSVNSSTSFNIIGANDLPTVGNDSIVVDNNDAGTSFTGEWKVSAATGYYGSDSLYGRNGASYKWKTSLPTSGYYYVYMRWTYFSNRSDAAPVTVVHDDGRSSLSVNQLKDSESWNLLGAYRFSVNQEAEIILDAPGTSASYNADAVKFVPVPVNELPTVSNDSIVVDNNDTGTSFTGEWKVSAATGYYGSDSLYGRNGASYKWKTSLPTSGYYYVYMRWTYFSSRSDAAPVTVVHDDGRSSLSVNQLKDSESWNFLGAYRFSINQEAEVILDAPGTVSSYSADAIIFIPVPVNELHTVNNDSIVVDNDDAGTSFTGEWKVSAATGYYGSDSLYGRNGASYKWKTSLPASGYYYVYMRWTYFSNRSDTAPVTVVHDDGRSSLSVNQLKNSESWNLLGTYHFSVNQEAEVILDAPGTIASYNADAIKFVPVPVNELPTVVDNGSLNTSSTGQWKTSSGVNYYGTDSVWGRNGATYTWSKEIMVDGVYAVYTWWTEYSNRTNKAEYTVTHTQGSDTVFANQLKEGGKWNLVGRYHFNTSQAASVMLMARDDDPVTYSADAIKFVYLPDVDNATGNEMSATPPQAVTPKPTVTPDPSPVVAKPPSSANQMISRNENDDPVNWQNRIENASGNIYLVSSASEFNAYADIAQPGDVILVNDGVYSWGNLVVSSSGTKEKPIIYTALNPGKVTFKNASILFKVTGNWNIIGGFTINDITKHLFRLSGGTDNRLTDNIINRPGNYDYGPGYLEILNQSHRTRFDHNTILGGKGVIRVVVNTPEQFSQDVRIDHNNFRGATLEYFPSGRQKAVAVLQVGQAEYYPDGDGLEVRTVFEYNTIENFYGRTQQMISNKSSYNIYRYNNFINSVGGIGLRHGDYNQIYGNYWKDGSGPEAIFIKGKHNIVANNVIDRPQGKIAISERMWGFRPANNNTTPPTGNNIVANNTIIASRKDYPAISLGYSSGGSKKPITGSIYVNNIITGEANKLFSYNSSGCIDCLITHNLYYATGSNIPGNGYDYDQNPFLGNPLLNGYLPTENSTRVIDQANSLVLDSVSVDFLGENRTKRGDPDLGAIEL